MHYQATLGGELAKLLIFLGDVETRKTQARVYLYNEEYDTGCTLTLLELIPQRRVAKLCKKRGITAEVLQRTSRDMLP